MAAPSVTPGMGGAGAGCALAGPAASARAAPPPARAASSRVTQMADGRRLLLAPSHRLARNDVIMMSPCHGGRPPGRLYFQRAYGNEHTKGDPSPDGEGSPHGG